MHERGYCTSRRVTGKGVNVCVCVCVRVWGGGRSTVEGERGVGTEHRRLAGGKKLGVGGGGDLPTIGGW